jgi:hypothetical protein
MSLPVKECSVSTCKTDWANSVGNGIDVYICKQCGKPICEFCFKKRCWKIGSGYDERHFKHCSAGCALKTRQK